MKVSKPAGMAMSAELSTDHPSSSYGRPVLVLGGSVALGPGDVAAEGLEVVDLGPGDALALVEGGFMLPLAEGTRDPFRLVSMLEALCRDVNVTRGDGESWRATADRCPEPAQDVMVYLGELLAKCYAEESFRQMSADDRATFSRAAWTEGIGTMYPGADPSTVLDWLERLISEECQTQRVK